MGVKEKNQIGALTVRQAISLSPEMARKRISKTAKRVVMRIHEFESPKSIDLSHKKLGA